jgi:hypothetical protein
MSKIDKLKRVMDLFEEGQELVLNPDAPEGEAPALLWVNKPNSFEVDEARNDGIAARSLRIQRLKSGDDPAIRAFDLEIEPLANDDLTQRIVQNHFDTDYVLAMDDVETDEGWTEKLDMIRRGQSNLEDADAPDDDPRWAELTKTTEEYMVVLREHLDKRQKERADSLGEQPRDELRELLLDQYVEREGMAEFLAEKRISEIYFSTRDCLATEKRADGRWNHGPCDHSVRLLDARSEIRGLPEHLLVALHDVLTAIEIDPRTAGNSDAPVSSSASLEPQSVPEDSTPSIPVETPSGVLTT